ncbi:DGQHR domain-containing protein [Turicibacter sanguinis]|uniref:DGQHR domain-containing protein n=1 Tax=Turicibacter sanguinis TaxID=154288 RepID=UPI0012BB84C6|nr:DGQHR domain-containing protein [Turicibacter sanguinis]MCU7196712.1 DGQHR domain-containing protein [Turicibacter sanguinis]MDB8439116.1 DGQHR domain-containing protein [Turicibacter sanguinis]MTO25231.1 DGQHR domain-containing protein [Turicibacter sanguinis]MTO27889.1 DGQHR domain-containing protein [Turicibacter sanguinis]MTO90804.1 DGQHR domain-containing protein [Turicibacter sanguinis]
MKKIYLSKVLQKTKQFYVMIEDPRLIVELLPHVEPGQTQEAQRPWSLKKVKEIAAYVAGKHKMSGKYRALGLIPNNPILVLNKPLEIKTEVVEVERNGKKVIEEQFYLLLPETAEEREAYKGTIEAMDGQHRLISFSKDIRDPLFTDDITYTMVFSVFEELSKNERKEIFMITNEKQDKVSVNLIRLLKRALGLLGADEAVYDLMDALNSEPFSVLHNRIIFGAAKITKGYKENQLSKIFQKSGTLDKLQVYGKDDILTMVRMTSNYLKAWEEVYKVSFQSPEKDTLTKISGLRYVFHLFPEILDLLVKQHQTASTENFKNMINNLPLATGVDDVFSDEQTSILFRGETSTVKLAQDHAKLLTSYVLLKTSSFDISDGI